jgi:TonB family protein
MVSLALHAVLVAVLAAAAFRPTPSIVSQRAVEIFVVSSWGSPPARGSAGGAPVKGIADKVSFSGLTRPRVTYDAARGNEPADQPESELPLAPAFPLPAAADVVSDTRGSGAGPTSAVMGAGVTGGTQFGWVGATRKLIRKRAPVFPAILSSAGQEVECQARISVSPSGRVTHVEIVGSSGYIEIDASVEAALRDYLFSRVDGRKDAVGTVRFHFRLERQD